MKTSGMIDLGVKPSKGQMPIEAPSPTTHYPTLWIRGVDGLDLSVGPITFTASGKVLSYTERETEKGETCDYEIEIHSMSPKSGPAKDLKEELDGIQAKKYKATKVSEED